MSERKTATKNIRFDFLMQQNSKENWSQYNISEKENKLLRKNASSSDYFRTLIHINVIFRFFILIDEMSISILM